MDLHYSPQTPNHSKVYDDNNVSVYLEFNIPNEVVFIHIEVKKLKFKLYKEILETIKDSLRALEHTELYAYPDDKNTIRLAKLLGFKDTHTGIPCSDGVYREVLVCPLR